MPFMGAGGNTIQGYGSLSQNGENKPWLHLGSLVPCTSGLPSAFYDERLNLNVMLVK